MADPSSTLDCNNGYVGKCTYDETVKRKPKRPSKATPETNNYSSKKEHQCIRACQRGSDGNCA